MVNNLPYGEPKKEKFPWGAVFKLAAILVGSVAWIVFFYWTLINAILATEGGLEIRLFILTIGGAMYAVWAVTKVFASRR